MTACAANNTANASRKPPANPRMIRMGHTTKQAAKALGVSRRSVQGHVKRGMLEAGEEGEGVNKTFYVSIDSLDALRNWRSDARGSSGGFADPSPKRGETANLSRASAKPCATP